MSFLRKVYYEVKPFVPVALRMAVRRRVARRLLPRVRHVWPILPEAGVPPTGWPGWPNPKQFAFVLTHDVEGPRGLANCEALMRLEMNLGFRSSFNFVPEGSYRVSPVLLNNLVKNGFEVGVHDLHHNGKLYLSKKRFDAAAPRINHYLRDWNAVGFRSGFMHRNLDWLHALDIEYDMSTFDTDPFEPQPDGADTIFPFWVPAPAASTLNAQLSTADRTQHSKSGSPLSGTLRTSNFELRTSPDDSSSLNRHSPFAIRHSRPGYLELPYTLPQDSTLFLLLQHQDITIWKQKLDWIAQHGGMALINVHPDYASFGSPVRNQYPAALYGELLQYAKSEYGASIVNLLPREVAQHLRTSVSENSCISSTSHAISSYENK